MSMVSDIAKHRLGNLTSYEKNKNERVEDSLVSRVVNAENDEHRIIVLTEMLEMLRMKEVEITANLNDFNRKSLIACKDKFDCFLELSNERKIFESIAEVVKNDLSVLEESSHKLSTKISRLARTQERLESIDKILTSILDVRQKTRELRLAIDTSDYSTGAKIVASLRTISVENVKGEEHINEEKRHLEQQLTNIIRQQFEAALSSHDYGTVSSCARLLLPLGLKRESTYRYISFLRHNLSDKCASNFRVLHNPSRNTRDLRIDQPHPNVLESFAGSGSYAGVLADAFVAVADVMGEHQQSIEQVFGCENFIVFLRGLQEEIDIQGVRILEKFESDTFSILKTSVDGNSVIEIKVVDMVLEELVSLSQRVQQFDAYLRRAGQHVLRSAGMDWDSSDLFKNPQYSRVDGLIILSALTKKMQELTNYYVSLEQYFMKSSCRKALYEIDELPMLSLDADDFGGFEALQSESNVKTMFPPQDLISTLPDDLFFILQKTISRAIFAGDVFAVCAVLNHVNDVLNSDVHQALESHLQTSKKRYSLYMSDPQNLTNFCFRTFLKNDDGRGSSSSWPHALNNVQAVMANTDVLISQSSREFSQCFEAQSANDSDESTGYGIQSLPNKRLMFDHCTQSLETPKAEFAKLLETHCKQTYKILKVHVKPVFGTLQNISFNISEEDYADYQINDPFMKLTILKLKEINTHLSAVLLNEPANKTFLFFVDLCLRKVESCIMTRCAISLLGAVQLDNDARTLMSCVTNMSQNPLRYKFQRLIEIGELLTVNSSAEINDFLVTYSGKKWHLKSTEIEKILELRNFKLNPAAHSVLSELSRPEEM